MFLLFFDPLALLFLLLRRNKQITQSSQLEEGDDHNESHDSLDEEYSALM
jgi:hypothetical protein